MARYGPQSWNFFPGTPTWRHIWPRKKVVDIFGMMLPEVNTQIGNMAFLVIRQQNYFKL